MRQISEDSPEYNKLLERINPYQSEPAWRQIMDKLKTATAGLNGTLIFLQPLADAVKAPFSYAGDTATHRQNMVAQQASINAKHVELVQQAVKDVRCALLEVDKIIEIIKLLDEARQQPMSPHLDRGRQDLLRLSMLCSFREEFPAAVGFLKSILLPLDLK